jgi:hypothetical protein
MANTMVEHYPPLPTEIPRRDSLIDQALIMATSRELYRGVSSNLDAIDSNLKAAGHAPGETLPICQEEVPYAGGVAVWGYIVGQVDNGLPISARLTRTIFPDVHQPEQPIETMFYIDYDRAHGGSVVRKTRYQRMHEGSLVVSDSPIIAPRVRQLMEVVSRFRQKTATLRK